MKQTEVQGKKISALCFGTAGIGDATDEKTSFRLLDIFREWGGTLVDTANVYGKWSGGINRSERLLGKYLKARGKGALAVATKGGHYDLSRPEICRVTRRAVRADAEESLAALGTDALEFYWLHRDNPALPAAEILGFLEELKGEGKIVRYGASNWTAARMRAADAAARENGFTGFFGLSNKFSAAKQPPPEEPTLAAADGETLAWLKESGTPLFPYSATASGFFAKRGGFSRPYPPRYARLECAENERRYAFLSGVSARTGCPMAGLAVAALLEAPFPVVPVFSASDETQLSEVLAGAETAFPAGTFGPLGLFA